MDNFRYVNEKCPVCGDTFTGTEDIVVCPLCGTPHHRDCYKKNGECGNMDKHNDGFIWSPTPVANEPAEAQCDQNTVPPVHDFSGGNFPPYASAVAPNPLPNFPPDLYEDVSTSDAAAYVKKNVPKYISKFFYERSGKHTFNFAAFFFNGYWFAYRKMYKLAVIILAAFLFLSCFPTFVPQYRALQTDIETASYEIKNVSPTSDDAQEKMNKVYSDLWQSARSKPIGVAVAVASAACKFALALYCGFIANKKYKDHVENSIKNIKTNSGQDTDLYKWRIINEGGTNFLMVIISTLAVDTASTLISLFSGSIFK